MNNYLNVAAVCPGSEALGPGNRFIIWVQGCNLHCPGCCSPEWKGTARADLISVEELANKITSQNNLEGVTISGGEPFLQARGLNKLIHKIQDKNPSLNTICYSGYEIDELLGMQDVIPFLMQLDVLVSGRYIKELNNNLGLRGSINQKIHFLSGRLLEYQHQFYYSERIQELFLEEDYFLEIGIPYKQKNTSHER